MHDFDYTQAPARLLTPEVVRLLTQIHEEKGKQELFLEANVDELRGLLEVAKIQSTGASNRIEGIFTSDQRLRALVAEKAEPRNRSEEEIAGYREVLSTIHESYDYIPVRANTILQLHRNLYAYSSGAVGGQYKNADNVIAETDAAGHRRVRFQPVPAFQTPGAMEALCDALKEAWQADAFDKLLLLLYKSGCIVGKYISLEMIIEATKDTYYDALQRSSQGWHEGANDYAPFVTYYLGIVLKAYREFESRVRLMQDRSLSKPERIRVLIDAHVGKITKNQIMAQCPDISKITVERTLTELVKTGYLRKVGAGRATAYVKAEDME